MALSTEMFSSKGFKLCFYGWCTSKFNGRKEINEFTEKALQIVWDDGEESIFFYDELREICPCATCRRLRKKSRTGKLPFKKRIPLGKSGLAPERIEYVGNYAIRFIGENWCETGFYTFDFLRKNSVAGE